MSEEKANSLIKEIENFAEERNYEILPFNEFPEDWTLVEYMIYREICYNKLGNSVILNTDSSQNN